ncbi:protein D3-like [Glandiceps talaboti]
MHKRVECGSRSLVRLQRLSLQLCTAHQRASTMDKHELVPDVIDKLPTDVATVQWENGVKTEIGNELTPTQVQKAPCTLSWPTETDAFYTVLMTDPDAPSRKEPKFREWHHWLVVNIPGCDISKGETVMEYVGSGPPQGTGLHRYVFLVYKQPGKITYTDPVRTNTSADGRGGVKARDVATKYQLGDPIACNLYQAEWDDYVPLLYKQLKP